MATATEVALYDKDLLLALAVLPLVLANQERANEKEDENASADQ